MCVRRVRPRTHATTRALTQTRTQNTLTGSVRAPQSADLLPLYSMHLCQTPGVYTWCLSCRKGLVRVCIYTCLALTRHFQRSYHERACSCKIHLTRVQCCTLCLTHSPPPSHQRVCVHGISIVTEHVLGGCAVTKVPHTKPIERQALPVRYASPYITTAGVHHSCSDDTSPTVSGKRRLTHREPDSPPCGAASSCEHFTPKSCMMSAGLGRVLSGAQCHRRVTSITVCL